MDWLKGKKTYIVAALMSMVSIVNMVTGDMTLVQFVGSEHLNTLLEAFGIGFLRAGIAKGIVVK